MASLFQQRLRTVIDSLNVPDKVFAEAGGITPPTLSGYLNTHREPTRETLTKWVQAYGIDAHWLLTGEGEEMFRKGPKSKMGRLLAHTGAKDEMELLQAISDKLDIMMGKSAEDPGGPQSSQTSAEDDTV